MRKEERIVSDRVEEFEVIEKKDNKKGYNNYESLLQKKKNIYGLRKKAILLKISKRLRRKHQEEYEWKKTHETVFNFTTLEKYELKLQ